MSVIVCPPMMLCGSCGCAMQMSTLIPRKKRVQIWCASQSCEQYGQHFWLPLTMLELMPAEADEV